jgi:hypothetical protein
MQIYYKKLLNLVNKFSRLQETASKYENQLSFYTLAMDNVKMNLWKSFQLINHQKKSWIGIFAQRSIRLAHGILLILTVLLKQIRAGLNKRKDIPCQGITCLNAVRKQDRQLAPQSLCNSYQNATDFLKTLTSQTQMTSSWMSAFRNYPQQANL